MKKLGLALVLLMGMLSHAQVSINVNVGTPPSWGPVGYDNSRYYYLPDIDIYYDINQSQFIYDNNGAWVRVNRLPSRYRNYDLYGGYKVVLNDYRGNTPYSYHSKHRAAYPKGYKGKPQKNRGNKPEKYNKPDKQTPQKNSPKKSNGNSNKEGNNGNGNNGNGNKGNGKHH
ncbi:hypothetical protein [Flavobacterium sp. 1355]|uniref:hypothetical protein n=1 Tax=Flavobacterium sp. 1355 TaxID=2806571 RepID=UPI001AE7FA4C|nr:hypothetical protein [Flavobacterium sp. 1355]MBP1222503.1 hypothetical protein [Flavobacterium sp. 1355]